MKKLDVLVAILLVIGGVNWGLLGFLILILSIIFFGGYIVDRVIYVIVGIAAVYQAIGWKAIQKRWKK